MEQQKKTPKYGQLPDADYEVCPRCGGQELLMLHDGTLLCPQCDWVHGVSAKEFWCPGCESLTMEYANGVIRCGKCGCTVELDCTGAEEYADAPGRWQIRELKAARVHPGIRRLDDSFSEFTVLETLELPEGLEEISLNAFAGCFRLRELRIPDSVRILGEYAFDSCAFSTLRIPEGVTEIPEGLCVDCKNLKEVILPRSVTSIGASAFRGCTSLRQVVLPHGDIVMGENAFPPETRVILPAPGKAAE